MSSLELMKVKGIPLPPIETEDGLTAQDIMNKIRGFYRKFEQNHDPIDMGETEAEFLGLLYHYPKSMCSRHMTESLKQLIALFYFESKPNPEEEKPIWNGYSYEDLAMLFDLSKATIYEAIRQKEEEVKKMLEGIKLRGDAKAIALAELVEEEKAKILLKNTEENKKTDQTTEQT